MDVDQPAGDVTDLAEEIGARTVAVLGAAQGLVSLLARRELCLTAVESCTGGSFVGLLTDIPGASEVVKDSFVTYSNEAKMALGVPAHVIKTYTVYSTETALAMAHAGLARSVRADVAVGITGSLSRPDPMNEATSVPGEVYVAVVVADGPEVVQKLVIKERSRPLAKLAIAAEVVDDVVDALRRRAEEEPT